MNRSGIRKHPFALLTLELGESAIVASSRPPEASSCGYLLVANS
jgi:hypothetical protein